MELAFEHKFNDQKQKKTLTKIRRLSTHKLEPQPTTGVKAKRVIYHDVDDIFVNQIVMPDDI